MSESFAEVFEESVKDLEMRPGMIVKGHVLEVGPDMVVVHAGLKSEGVIPLSEFKDMNGEIEVQVGDEVEVMILEIDEDAVLEIMGSLTPVTTRNKTMPSSAPPR